MELTILQHLAGAMAGTLHLDGVLGIVLQSIVNDLGYSGGMIFLADESGVLGDGGARERLSSTRVVIRFSGGFCGEEVVSSAPRLLPRNAASSTRVSAPRRDSGADPGQGQPDRLLSSRARRPWWIATSANSC